MRGRGSGCVMGVQGTILPGSRELWKRRGWEELSKRARQRLKWFDYYERHGRNARLTCRYFGISPQTFYRWKGRYDPRDLRSLEDRSHRPRRVRQGSLSVELVEAVRELRERYPRWGKDKLVVLLKDLGYECSASTVGRILRRLKSRGVLREPEIRPISARKRSRRRPYATRKPKWYHPRMPGDLVQVDTLDVRPWPGVVIKHFTARDQVSRWDVVQAFSRATAESAAAFLDRLTQRLPFPVRAISPEPQRPRRKSPENPHRGVLPGLPHQLRPPLPQPQPPPLGDHLQHQKTSPGPGLPHPPSVPGKTGPSQSQKSQGKEVGCH